jgi:peptidoglycan/xylan/chitin deacetylase (PgdA/CDA1 family)
LVFVANSNPGERGNGENGMTRPCAKLIRNTILGALALISWAGLPNPAQAADSAVILMYHRFGETNFPSTNIRLEQFEAHLKELESGPYTVLPVPEIVDAVREGRPLPDRTIGITMDDGYLSIYTEAFQRLQDAGFPFTVFISTNPVDRKFGGFMNWNQIREMRDAGVTIGAHTSTHLHMAASTVRRNREDLTESSTRLKEELGAIPALFAYPFGEASSEIQNLVREQGHQLTPSICRGFL